MTKYRILLWTLGLTAITWVSLLTDDKTAYFLGFSVSLINALLAVFFRWWYGRKIPRYSGQTLAIVVQTVVIRFVTVGALLIYSFKWLELTPKSIILGFVIGQIFFLINQLITVVKNDGK